MRYLAVDPIWTKRSDPIGLVDLREHVRRLCRATYELGMLADAGWADVSHNLKLAYSVTDVFANTDVDGTSGYCNAAADFEDADDELTEKHLAATIIFTFSWTAYECAVEATSPNRAGKGARGRDLVSSSRRHLAHLRAVVFEAAGLSNGGTDFGRAEMRRMLSAGSLPGIAAEHLRQFRNRLIHGDLPKPPPRDWGEGSRWLMDADPHLRQFHANVRLVLLLIQLLALEAGVGNDIDDGEPGNQEEGLAHLHCAEDHNNNGMQLAFDWLCVSPSASR